MTDDFSNRLASAKKTTIVFDLRALGGAIELACEDKLNPPPKGIYVNTQLEPVLVDGVRYYEVINGQSEPLKDINQATGPIVNGDGKRLITQTQMKNKSFTLSDTPILPYRGIKIAKMLYDHQIDRRIHWRRFPSNRFEKIANMFVSSVDMEEIDKLMDEFSIEVQSNLQPLIDDHEWHLYTTLQTGYSLRVERGEDYRVAYFMEKLKSGEITL